MQPTPSFRDDLVHSLLAFLTGSLAGLSFSFPVGLVAFHIIESGCSGQYMCGLGAAIWAIIIGLGVGLLAFGVGAVRSVRRHCAAGQRLRPGLLTFVGVPIFVALLLSATGMG